MNEENEKDLSIGKPIKCNVCGRKYKWTGYVQGNNVEGGKDKAGWHLQFDEADHLQHQASYYDKYSALCPDCQRELS